MRIEQARGQRLGQLGAVAVERVGLEAQAPGQHVGVLAVVDAGLVGHVDGLGDGARDEGLGRRHHADVAVHRKAALAAAPAAVGAVEDGQVLGLQARRAFQHHGPAAVGVGGLDLGLREAERGQHVEGEVVEPRLVEAQRLDAEVAAERPLVERELDVEGAGQARLERLQGGLGEALLLEPRVADAGRVLERAEADRVADDLLDLGLAVAERAQGVGHRAVDDLEVAAAGQLLELDDGELRLDAGGVAVHDQADGARGRDHRGLGVAVAVRLAELERPVPGALGRLDQHPLGAGLGVERHRLDREALVAGLLGVGGAAVVADYPAHGLGVLGVAREGAELLGHLGRGGVGDPGHDRGQRAAIGPARVGIVGQAEPHQQPADVGVAETQGTELIGEPGDLARGELRHQHRDLEHHGPQAHGVLEGRDVEAAVVAAERHEVERGQVAGGVVEEHVLGTGIGGVDPARFGAGVPLVDRGVVLHARVGAGPGGEGDLLPQVARRNGLVDLAVGAPGQVPVAVGQHRLDEAVGHPDRVVGVLAGDGEIGIRIPVRVVARELDRGEALARQLHDPLDVVLRHLGPARGRDRLLELGVALGIDGGVLVLVAGILWPALLWPVQVTGLHDRVQVPVAQLRAGDQGGDLLLLDHLPVDVVLDVRVVDVDADHLGRAPRGAARLDGAGRAVADLEERHQPGGLAAAREQLVLAAQLGEVGAGARAVLEQPGLAHPQVHDAAVVDQVVLDRLDEAGVRLRPLVGRGGATELAGLEIDVVMALARPVDAVGPVQAGVEPLRRVGRRHLARQHEAQLVVKRARVLLGVEVAALPAPVGPGPGQAVEDLLGAPLAAAMIAVMIRVARALRLGFLGDRAPQPRRHGVLLDPLQLGRHAALAEVLLRQHVAGDLAPAGRHLDVLRLEHHRAVRVADFARGGAEFDGFVSVFPGFRKTAFDPHNPAVPSALACWLYCPRFLKAFRAPIRMSGRLGRRPRPGCPASRPSHSYGGKSGTSCDERSSNHKI